MPDPNDPVGDADTTPSLPAEPARGGRPSQLTRERVAAAIDEALAETGREPSVRELQARLGGGRTRLTALRDAVRAERLIAAAVPTGGTTADALTTATDAVLQVLATEALRAADRAIDTARTEADARVEAAERLAARAGEAERAAALERERLLGRLETLEARLGRGPRDGRGPRRRARRGARTRDGASRDRDDAAHGARQGARRARTRRGRRDRSRGAPGRRRGTARDDRGGAGARTRGARRRRRAIDRAARGRDRPRRRARRRRSPGAAPSATPPRPAPTPRRRGSDRSRRRATRPPPAPSACARASGDAVRRRAVAGSIGPVSVRDRWRASNRRGCQLSDSMRVRFIAAIHDACRKPALDELDCLVELDDTVSPRPDVDGSDNGHQIRERRIAR